MEQGEEYKEGRESEGKEEDVSSGIRKGERRAKEGKGGEEGKSKKSEWKIGKVRGDEGG